MLLFSFTRSLEKSVLEDYQNGKQLLAEKQNRVFDSEESVRQETRGGLSGAKDAGLKLATLVTSSAPTPHIWVVIAIDYDAQGPPRQDD